jgi:hypothetical protein
MSTASLLVLLLNNKLVLFSSSTILVTLLVLNVSDARFVVPIKLMNGFVPEFPSNPHPADPPPPEGICHEATPFAY